MNQLVVVMVVDRRGGRGAPDGHDGRECELDVAAAGPDAFRLPGPTLEGAVFKFVVSKAGEVTAVRLEAGEQPILFKR